MIDVPSLNLLRPRVCLVAAAATIFAIFAVGCPSKVPNTNAPPSVPASLANVSVETSTRDSGRINQEPGPIHFQQLTPAEIGVDFVYYGNPSAEHYMTEQNGGGTALFDFDQDGWSDLFFVNGSHFDRPASEVGATHHLYRNRGDTDLPRFDDVTTVCGLDVSGFGMGTTVGDFDNDGFADLFVCYFGSVQLWRNHGDGTFEDVTSAARIHDDSWSASAAFADLDDDGDLDLYVTNYVVYSPKDGPCYSAHHPPVKISCGPIGRTAQPDQLWENLGNGTFNNASKQSGIHAVDPGKGLALEIVDLDGDGRLDVFVANDTSDNFLFHNMGELRFEDIGRVSGVAVGENGKPASSMGIACADFDGNGRFDLFVTNFENATNNFYDNLFETTFLNRTAAAGLDAPSRPMLAFGTVASDFDLDGYPDLFVANGHIWDLGPKWGHLYEMPPQLFRNLGGRRFADVSVRAGNYFEKRWLGRAAATADLDRDGDTDLVISHELQSAAVLLNDSSRQGHSTLLRVIGTTAAREPRGIRVTYRIGTQTYATHIPSGGSFASVHDPRLILSCGSAGKINELTVHWRAGSSQTWHDLPIDMEVTLVEGSKETLERSEPLRSDRARSTSRSFK